MFGPILRVLELYTSIGRRKASAFSNFNQLIKCDERRFHLLRLFRSIAAGITTVKAVNASGRVNEFLFSGKERVALGADFDVKILAHRRARLKSISARAGDGDLFIIRMYFRFHLFNGLLLLMIAVKNANCNNMRHSDESSSQKVGRR
jgi:hypothetical protein